MSFMDAFGGTPNGQYDWGNTLLNVYGSKDNPTLQQGVYSNWDELMQHVHGLPATYSTSAPGGDDGGGITTQDPQLFTIDGYGGKWTSTPDGAFTQYLGGYGDAPGGTYIADIENDQNNPGNIAAFIRNDHNGGWADTLGSWTPYIAGAVLGAVGGAAFGPAIAGATGASAGAGSAIGSFATTQVANAYMNGMDDGSGSYVNPNYPTVSFHPDGSPAPRAGNPNGTPSGGWDTFAGSAPLGGSGTPGTLGGSAPQSTGGLGLSQGGLAAAGGLGALAQMGSSPVQTSMLKGQATDANMVPISQQVAQVPYADAKQIRMPDINSFSLENSIDGSTMGGYAGWKAQNA